MLAGNPPLLENFEGKNVQGAGVDLRLGNVYRIKTGAKLLAEGRVLPEVEKLEDSILTVKPGEYLLAETAEKINTPADMLALVLPRTTLFRSGVSLRTGVIDPGYKGTLTFGLKNESDQDFVLEKGARVAQMIFIRVDGGTRPYDGVYQGGKVVASDPAKKP